MRQEAAGKQEIATANCCAWEVCFTKSETWVATTEAQVDKRTDNRHCKELAQQAIVTIARHLWFQAEVREVWCVRGWATVEIVRKRDLA